jgi:hypothetical protein
MTITKIPSIGLEDTGVGAGTVGSASQIPVITVNAQGQVTSKTTAALDLSVKVSKSGDTMTGNLTIQNTAPTLVLQDTDNGVTKQIHHNSDLIGFLSNDANWLMYGNNAGQIWSRTYGWLHDAFATKNTFHHAVSITGNCANAYGGSINASLSGNTLQLSLSAGNCACACNCACSD